MLKKTQKNKTQQSTQTQTTCRVFQEDQEFRVESWTRQEVKELAEEMNWNTNHKGNYE